MADATPAPATEEEDKRPWYLTLTRYQWTILIVAWLGWVFDIFDTAIFYLAKTSIFEEMMGKELYKTDGPRIEGNIQMFFLIGWALGGLIFGVLADKWGRTRTLVITILLYSLFTGLTALCQTPLQVGIARFLTALGIGGEWAAGAALIAEVVPNRARVAAAAFLQSAAAVGPALAALSMLALKDFSWRWLFIVGIVPALVCVVIRLYVKEPESTATRLAEGGNPLKEIFGSKQWMRIALLAMVVGAVGVTGAGTVTYWTPNLVKEVSEGMADAAVKARISHVTMLAHIGTLLGVLIVPWLCSVFGRKRTIASFFILAPLSVALAIGGGTDYERLKLLLPLTYFFAIGVSAAFVLYFPELFPTRFRATGSGLAYNAGRALSIAMPPLTAWIMAEMGHSVATGVLFSFGIYVFGVIAIAFAPETKGKALEV